MRTCILAFLAALNLPAATPEWTRANNLYLQTEYQQSLAILQAAPEKDAAALQLTGQNFFMLGEYKKASDSFEKAAALDPNNAKLTHWMGRAYGRRAETANPFSAPGLASKTRQMFEKAVELDPTDKDALGDLLDYYLDAPGFLGGGMHKAEMLAQMILKEDPAEGHYAQGLVADKQKEYATAEQQFRRAVELGPRQVGHILVLARYLANHDHVKESDALFEQAARMAPNNPRVMFDRAATYIREKRDLDTARKLLEQYLEAPLTPEDPPRQRAMAMLKQLGS
ncbi:MAG TPA: tetratricopeptide repeat protein [Bryobacteraceae bacterium]|nr:tetratricopeptide repeat protein [Bryobacteraceae bacterium]